MDLAISVIGIAILVGLARIVFAKPASPLTAASAADRLAFDEPDFGPVAWALDLSNGAALARNNAGELAIVTAHGDGLVTRRFAKGVARGDFADGRLIIHSTDHTWRDVVIEMSADEARAWLSRMAT